MGGIAWDCSPENGTRHVGFNNTNVSLDDRPPKCRCHATYQLRRQVLKAYNERTESPFLESQDKSELVDYRCLFLR